MPRFRIDQFPAGTRGPVTLTSPPVPGTETVSVNCLKLPPDQYTITGRTLTILAADPTSAEVHVQYVEP